MANELKPTTFFPSARKLLAEKDKKSLAGGLLGAAAKGFKSEITMGYGVSDEPPKLSSVPEKVAYGAGSLFGMMPSFAAAAAVPALLPARATLGAARLARLAKTLHKIGKPIRIKDAAGKVRQVSKLGLSAEAAAKGARTFAIHGAAHELTPEEKEAGLGDRVLSRGVHGLESAAMGTVFGATAPLAGASRLGQIGIASGVGAGATALTGGSTEDILIQGGLLGALSAAHIGVKDAHRISKEIATELDKLSEREREKRLIELTSLGEAPIREQGVRGEQTMGGWLERRAEAAETTPERKQELDIFAKARKLAAEREFAKTLEPVEEEAPGYASDRAEYARRAAETAPSEEEVIRQQRLDAAHERSENMLPLGVPGSPPLARDLKRHDLGDWLEGRRKARPSYPIFGRLPGKGRVLEEPSAETPGLVDASGKPVSKLRAEEEQAKLAAKEKADYTASLTKPGAHRTAEDILRLKPKKVSATIPEKIELPEKKIAKPDKRAKGLRVFGIKKPLEPKVKSTEKGDEVSVPIPKEKAERLSPKKQKEFLMLEIDKAMKTAPEVEDASTKRAYITIKVPGDGEFKVINAKEPLQEFKKLAKGFPSSGKPKRPAVPGLPKFFAKPNVKMTGKRILGEDVEYYNEFQPRKQEIIENEPLKQYYKDGYFSTGAYIIKAAKKPKTKNAVLEGDKSPDLKSYLEGDVDLLEAKIIGEFKPGRPAGGVEKVYAHVKDAKGKDHVINAQYADIIFTKFPKAKSFVGPDGRVIFKEGKKFVGAIAPIDVEGPMHLLSPSMKSRVNKFAKVAKPAKKKAPSAKPKEEKEVPKKKAVFRGGPESAMPKGKTAYDVIEYERKELGNTIKSELSKSELGKLPAKGLQWVSPTEKAAAEFGPAKEIKGDYRVIATDPYGGMLIEPAKTGKKLTGTEFAKKTLKSEKGQITIGEEPPPRKIPKFKGTAEAQIWGEKATDTEVKQLKQIHQEYVDKAAKLQIEGKINESFTIAQKGSFYREAYEAKELGIPEFARKLIEKHKAMLKKKLKDEKGSSELIGDLSRIGAAVIKKGFKTFKEFVPQMKQELGKNWEAVKHLVKRAYDTSRKILKSEKGQWDIYRFTNRQRKQIEETKKLQKEINDTYNKLTPSQKTRAGRISINQMDLDNNAKKTATVMGLEYNKKYVPEKEIDWIKKANRIAKDQKLSLDTLEKLRKGKKLDPGETRFVRDYSAAQTQLFTNKIYKAELKDINNAVKQYQNGIAKAVNDLASERGRGLRVFLETKKSDVTLAQISKTFSKIKRELREQDKEIFDHANEAMENGDHRAMLSFLKYLDATQENPRIRDYVYEYWYNSILSGAPTQVVNVASNTAWAVFQLAVHRPMLAAIDPIVAKFQGRQRKYYFDEIIPALAGFKKGLKSGYKPAKDVLIKGWTTDAKMDKWTLEMGQSIGAFARSPNKYLRAAAPYLTWPTRALRAMDVWFNQAAYESELAAICKRMEKQGKGKFNDLMKNPTEEMMNDAAEFAAYSTFMDEPGKFTKRLEQLRDAAPGIRFNIPFIRTISNLTKRGIEMTPGLGLALGGRKLLKPKTSGAEISQILTKQIEGAVITMVIASLVADGKVTGAVPTDKSEREAFYRQGKLPWAIKVGDNWIQYRRLEPFNSPIASVAIAYDTWKKTGKEPSTELVWQCVSSVVENILDSSYLSGLTQVLDSVRGADTSPQKITNYIDRLTASFLPFSSFQRSLVRATEAYGKEGAIVRKPKGIVETAKSIVPGLSKEVPAKKDVWGADVIIPGTPFEQWLPWKAAKETGDKVELEIERLHKNVDMPYPGTLARYITIKGERIDLDDKQYDKLLITSGKAAKKRLNKLVGTMYWRSLSDKEKANRIKRVIREARKTARSEVKKELGFPTLKKAAGRKKKKFGHIPALYGKNAATTLF